MKINPVLDYIIVQELKQPDSLLILDQARSALDEVVYGHVVAAGPGRCDSAGQLMSNSVKADDRVVFQRAFGTPLCISGRDVWILRESQIIAILTEKENDVTGINAKIKLDDITYAVPEHIRKEVARMIAPYAPADKEAEVAEPATKAVDEPKKTPEDAKPAGTADEEVTVTASDDGSGMSEGGGETTDTDSESER